MFDITWILAGVSLFGSFLNAKKKIACFYIWAVGEVFWLTLDITKDTFGRAFLDLTQLCFALYGAYEWRRLEKNEKIKSKRTSKGNN